VCTFLCESSELKGVSAACRAKEWEGEDKILREWERECNSLCG